MNNAKVFQTWFMLKLTYALAPIALGLDKCFFGLIVDWSKYVSPTVVQNLPMAMDISQFVMAVGIIEILAGIIVWFYPRFGAYLVIGWLLAIIINLATMNAMYDIIARDAVIAIGALALAWLTEAVQEK